MRRKLVGDRNEPAAFRHLAEGHQGYDSRIGFRFLDGRMRSLPYSHLMETEYDPSVGIILRFVSYRVTVEGRNLVGLYTGLEDGAVGEILEQHDSEMLVSEEEPFIRRIGWEAS